ncbi:DUF5110 domain-containing protein, partial [Cronobacter sakazakii]
DARELKLYPLPGSGQSAGLLFEDDGESWGYREGNALWVNWQMQCSADAIHLTFSTTGDYQPAWQAIDVTLPENERRTLYINGQPGQRWTR